MSKTFPIRSFFLFIVLFVLAQSASANGAYVQLNAGASYLEDMKSHLLGDPIKISSDRGFNVGGAVGYRIKSFRVEASFDYLQADVSKINVLGDTYDSRKNSTLFTMMANGYYDLDLGHSVKPYVGAGIGAGRINLDDKQGDLVDTDGKYGRGTTFAWNVMAGLTWSLNEQLDLLAGYRYAETLKVKMNGDVPSQFSSGNFKVKMTANELRFGLRYNF